MVKSYHVLWMMNDVIYSTIPMIYDSHHTIIAFFENTYIVKHIDGTNAILVRNMIIIYICMFLKNVSQTCLVLEVMSAQARARRTWTTTHAYGSEVGTLSSGAYFHMLEGNVGLHTPCNHSGSCKRTDKFKIAKPRSRFEACFNKEECANAGAS